MKEIAVFGGGCFWCTEAVFESLRGILSADPGYAGGDNPAPTYKQVHEGDTGHAEVIRVEYDPSIITYRDLLTVFFFSHDSTTKDRQGADVGTQYRSMLMYTSAAQKEEAEKFIEDLKAAGTNAATQVLPYKNYHPAEAEHKDYYQKNKAVPYCQINIAPKIKKLQERFAELMKTAGN